ncbi:hypothetical protein PVL29_005023 [Vitis rotundifolia]|uniref:Uncharacterized protein n=1 Tax=Vitis rotundifolia TaxID=103349 RepID=A0AA39ABW4_VITRO|nr:hypothetical protein PVL29_005023 [Vitis rotundifolia]
MGSLGRAIYTVGVWFREGGQAIDRLGCRLQGKYHFQEQVHVKVGQRSSIWYGCVLRGDVNSISIGSGTSIEDNALVHVAKSSSSGKVLPTTIGDNVTVGHGAVLHGCTVENEAFIGMGATLLDGVLRNMDWLLLEPLYCRVLGSPNHLPRKFLLKKLRKVLRKKFAYPETDYAALVSVDRETPPELILPYNILLEKLRKAT